MLAALAPQCKARKRACGRVRIDVLDTTALTWGFQRDLSYPIVLRPVAEGSTGFALLMPGQTAANNRQRCFNWFRPGDTGHDLGEAGSIAAMAPVTTASSPI